MPRELRKRKEAPAVEPAAAPPAKKKTAAKKGPVAKAVAKVKEVAEKVKEAADDAITPAPIEEADKTPKASALKVEVGNVIDLEGFGGEIETHDGVKTTLKKLVEESKGGVVLFTYPAASTPGCTKQACQFRDKYTPLIATGLSIYGLSKDTPKSNTNFKTKQNLPYPLLCDPKRTLIGAINLKKGASAQRGVFVIDKSGKILASQHGSPSGTVEVVEALVEAGEPKGSGPVAANGTNGASKDDIAKANVAADVADTAEKLDSNE